MKKPLKFFVDEDALQIYSADVIAAFKVPGVIAYHTPNGGKRHISVAKQLKRMGTLRGVPDWTFLMPGAVTKFLELKDLNGRQSKEQIDFERSAGALGFEYRLANSPETIDAALAEMGVINKTGVEQSNTGTQPAEGRNASCSAGAASVKRSRSRTTSSPKASESRL